MTRFPIPLLVAALLLVPATASAEADGGWTVEIFDGSEQERSLACERKPGKRLECISLGAVLEIQDKQTREDEAKRRRKEAERQRWEMNSYDL